MRAVIQRVSEASVKVDDRITGEINTGLMVLLGMERMIPGKMLSGWPTRSVSSGSSRMIRIR